MRVNSIKDRSGEVFGDWTILRRADNIVRPSQLSLVRWICRCSCGEEKPVEIHSLKNGRSFSCGHRKHRLGKENPGWKGGLTLHKSGYVVVNGSKIDGKYPQRKFQHQLVMEKFLGRKLTRNETVHHKNGVRHDNRIKNLELWASRHPKGQRVSDLVKWAKELLRDYNPKVLR